ncbi:MAG: methyl-accepting chemotaxis protein [Saccharospirillum sp.]
MFRLQSIRAKLLLSVSATFVTAILVAVLLSRHTIQDTISAANDSMEAALVTFADDYVQMIAEDAALQVKLFLEKGMVVVDEAGAVLNATSAGNGGEPFSRSRVKELNRIALAANPSISAIYAQFEPNGYDNRDDEHRGNLEHSTMDGTLETYWVRESGELVYYETEDASEKYGDATDEYGIRENEWYLCSRDRGEPCLLDPYLYEIEEGVEELMTTYTVPIMHGARFAGLIGIDVNLPVIQQQLLALNEETLNGAGALTIVSQGGFLVASTQFADQIGGHLSEISPTLLEMSAQESFTRENGQWFVNVPINFEGVADQWAAIYTLPEEVVLGPVAQLRQAQQERGLNQILNLTFWMLVVLAVSLLGVWTLIRSLVGPISQMSRRMQDLSTNEGDLSQSLPDQQHQELAVLSHSFNHFTDKLREMIQALLAEKDALIKASSDMSENGQAVDHQSQLQREKLDSIVTAMTQMAASANEVAQLASTTAGSASESNELITRSQSILQSNREVIQQLSEDILKSSEQVGRVADQSQQIYGILNTIKTIADQTNLLALNAAIEAARAGEQGRGFAVVADEVRSLAARTQESTKEVDELIQGLQNEVDSAVTMLGASQDKMKATVEGTEDAYESLNQAVSQVANITENATQVASAATEQSSVSDEISEMVTDVGDAASQLSDLATKTALLTQEAGASAQRMDEQLSRLKV